MTVPQFEIGEERDGLRTVVAPRGEIDLATVGLFREALERACGDGDLWVDLTGVEFIDSTGLTALLSGQHAMADGRRIRIICPGGAVRRAFEISGLDEVLDIYPSHAAAEAA